MPGIDRTVDFAELAVKSGGKWSPPSNNLLADSTDSFLVSARSVQQDLLAMLRHLIAKRHAYLSVANLSSQSQLAPLVSIMTDDERLQLEQRVLHVANKCQTQVEMLKELAVNHRDLDDVQQHRQMVVFLLMRQVALLTDRMKALREARTRALQRQKENLLVPAFEAELHQARLASAAAAKSSSSASSSSSSSSSPSFSSTFSTNASLFTTSSAAASSNASESDDSGIQSMSLADALRHSDEAVIDELSTPYSSSVPSSSKKTSAALLLPNAKSSQSKSANSSSQPASSSTSRLMPHPASASSSSVRQRHTSSSSSTLSSQTSPSQQMDANDSALEQVLELQQENALMLESFESELNSIRESEQKLEQISALMSDFSSKVLMQAETIESVHATTLLSSMHLSKGQNELKEATEYKVNFRLMILFFMLVSGFSLLFLDWYQ